MSAHGTIKVQLGRFPLEVPVLDDPQTTLELVEQVNERLKEIENQGGRVDTTAYALKTALSFAADLRRSEQERAGETKDILVALDAISDALCGILNAAGMPQE